ncbi:A/G-specific adenine glycosylase [uncultured Sunxiuqinia sp.]|uniref:A/G-specific adenine glycosylase n=1 Tax=uncultured Sunxiuqinia sp. TaxID=1573825 RepID=UPI00260D1155|nr:A/G-specific adenine glycosylase [uncultured Sunxiuqinia sp.]
MTKDASFSKKLLHWYEFNKRDLPWRETADPYAIWLSEIILQQTRIDQGMAYYIRFLDAYPSVNDFAKASEDEILKLWQGLGYYSRARNMHHTAREIVSQHQGRFPADYQSLLRLKGIGEYTAAAIASIAYNLPHAAVDGNVFRVLSRINGIETPIDTGQGKKQFTALANELLDPQQAGNFNQALMEFGATLCTPKKPGCESCPFNTSCVALRNETTESLPVKKGKVKIRKRFFNYLIINDGSHTYLSKRTSNDIWKNLYEFPLTETSDKKELHQTLVESQLILPQNAKIEIEEETPWQKQVLSHQHIFYRFIYLKIGGKIKLPSSAIKVNKKDIFNFAVPKPIEKELNRNNWL